MIALLLPVVVLAQADAGARWAMHPRIVAVREAVAEIDRQVTDAGVTYRCALSSTAELPKSVAALKKVHEVDLYGPDYETLEIARATAGDLERVTWRWERRGVSETEERDGAEVTRWSRGRTEVFVHAVAGSNGLGWSSLDVRAWSDAKGSRFWWATTHDGSEGRSQSAGPTAESGTLAWLTPEERLGYLRPCTAQQAARIKASFGSGLEAADLPLIKATWVKRKP